jgi:indole-3-glycerol phosphate synthase
MNILDKIIEYKKTVVAEAKVAKSIEELKASPLFDRQTISLKQFLLDETRNGIIAEFKRQSPSKGVINAGADVVAVTGAYAKYGASGLSVLTDEAFFGGSDADLLEARVNEIPILRKDFMIDEYQLLEAKAMGADVILLIAACLSPERVKELAIFAKNLGLEVLLEIHSEEELAHICEEVELVGVNNRDLKTFVVDVNRSVDLAEKIPADKIKISESGISDATTIHLLKQHGYRGFLIGENFMKTTDPGAAFGEFVGKLMVQS